MKTRPRLQEGHNAKTFGVSLSYAELDEINRLCEKNNLSRSALLRAMIKLWVDTEKVEALPIEELKAAWGSLLKNFTVEKKTS